MEANNNITRPNLMDEMSMAISEVISRAVEGRISAIIEQERRKIAEQMERMVQSAINSLLEDEMLEDKITALMARNSHIANSDRLDNLEKRIEEVNSSIDDERFSERVIEVIDNYDLDDKVEAIIDDYDMTDRFEEYTGTYQFEDRVKGVVEEMGSSGTLEEVIDEITRRLKG